MTQNINNYLKLEWRAKPVWIEIDSSMTQNYALLELNNITGNTLTDKLAVYKIGHYIFINLKEIYSELKLCSFESTLPVAKDYLDYKINLATPSLFGNEITLIITDESLKYELDEHYQLYYKSMPLPKLSSIHGDLYLRLTKLLKYNHQITLHEELCKATDKTYLKLSFKVVGQIQSIYIPKSIVKHLAQIFKPKTIFTYNEIFTNHAIFYIEKFISLILNMRCIVEQWSYCKLSPQKLFYHFSFKNKYFSTNILCDEFTTITRSILEEHLFKQPIQDSSVDILDKTLNFSVIAAETEIIFSQLQTIQIGDVILCETCQVKTELGEATLYFEERQDKLFIERITCNE